MDSKDGDDKDIILFFLTVLSDAMLSPGTHFFFNLKLWSFYNLLDF